MYKTLLFLKQSILITLTIIVGLTPGFTQCDLICKDQVTLNIAPLDQLKLSYDELLSSDYSACNPEDLLITLKDENGNFINPPIIQGSHIGQTLIALVVDENTGVSCNSSINVEANSLNCVDTLYIDINTTSSGNEMEVSFDVRNFTELASMQMSIHYDSELLNYLDYSSSDLNDMYASNFSESSPGVIRMLWYNNFGSTSTLADGSSVFKLKFFMVNSGTAKFEIKNQPIPIEIANGEGNLFCLNVNGQNVNVNSTNNNSNCQLDCLSDVVASFDGTPTTIKANDFFTGNINNCPDLDLVISLFSPSGIIHNEDHIHDLSEIGTYTYVLKDLNQGQTCTGTFRLINAYPSSCIDTIYIDVTSTSDDEMVLVSFDVEEFNDVASLQFT